jgi:hypothetical protein
MLDLSEFLIVSYDLILILTLFRCRLKAPRATTTITRLATPPVATNEPPPTQHSPNDVNRRLGPRKFFYLFLSYFIILIKSSTLFF